MLEQDKLERDKEVLYAHIQGLPESLQHQFKQVLVGLTHMPHVILHLLLGVISGNSLGEWETVQSCLECLDRETNWSKIQVLRPPINEEED